MHASLLAQTLLLIVAAACSVAAARGLRLPATLGFLAAGVVMGPHGFGVLTPGEATTFVSDLGIVFLMFLVGLEFSLADLVAAKATVLGAGGLQVGLTAVVVAAIAGLAGVAWPAAIVVGGATALSSTALTVKCLAERGELGAPHGRLAVGILLFQDLATLPLLVLTGPLPAGGLDVSTVLAQFIVAAAGLVLIGVAARPVLRATLTWVARAHSEELFVLSALALALGAALSARQLGLPLSIGAFLAGMIVGESDVRHRIEDDIRPFRDVLLGFFFMSIGTQLDPHRIAAAPLPAIGWLLVFTAGKAALAGVAVRMLGWPAHVAVRTGVLLGHAGEFALLLLAQAMSSGMLDPAAGQPMLAALLLTIGLAPLMFEKSGPIADVVARSVEGPDAQSEAGGTLTDHVVLCGWGRVGRPLTIVLELAKVPYIALESDMDRFKHAKRSGHNVLFADVNRARTLDRVAIDRARAVVVTVSERRTVLHILRYSRHRNPAAPLIVNVTDDAELAELVAAGATVVFPEHLAAGLALARQVLRLRGVPEERAAAIVAEARASLVPELRGL